MLKKLFVIALLSATYFAHATSYTMFSGLSCNSSYSCNFPSSGYTQGSQVTDCTFTFTSCSANYGSLLFCNLFGSGSSCSVGSQNGGTTTWTCTLNQNGLDYLNNCLNSGNCNFGLNCSGNWNIGSCSVNYNCNPTPHNTVPDTSSTVLLLGAAFLGLEVFRRRFQLARAK